jgi:hypothetical protein
MMDIGRALFLFTYRDVFERYFHGFENMLLDRIYGVTPLEEICNHPQSELYFHTSLGKYLVNDVMEFIPKAKPCCFRRLTANFYDLSRSIGLTEINHISVGVDNRSLGLKCLVKTLMYEMSDCVEGLCSHLDTDIPALVSLIPSDLRNLLSVDSHKQVIISYSFDFMDENCNDFEVLVTQADKSAVFNSDSLPRLLKGQYFDCWFIRLFDISCYSEVESHRKTFSFSAMRHVLLKHWVKIALHYDLSPTSKITVYGNFLRQWEPPHITFVLDGEYTWPLYIHNKNLLDPFDLTLKSCTSIFLVTVSDILQKFTKNIVEWRGVCINPFVQGTYDMIVSLAAKHPFLLGLYLVCRMILSVQRMDRDITSAIPFTLGYNKKKHISLEVIQKSLALLKVSLNTNLMSLATYGDDKYFMTPNSYDELPPLQRNYVYRSPTHLIDFNMPFQPKPGSVFSILSSYSHNENNFLLSTLQG